jgi:flagellar basal body-associated protein FliL
VLEKLIIEPLIVFGLLLAASLVVIVWVLLAGAPFGIVVLTEFEYGVVFRFGRFAGVKAAGFHWITPFVDRLVRISTRPIVMEVPEREVALRGNRKAKVRADVCFRVSDPARAVLEVENYIYSTSEEAKDSLRKVLGEANATDLETGMGRLECEMKERLDSATVRWGVRIDQVSLNCAEAKRRAMEISDIRKLVGAAVADGFLVRTEGTMLLSSGRHDYAGRAVLGALLDNVGQPSFNAYFESQKSMLGWFSSQRNPISRTARVILKSAGSDPTMHSVLTDVEREFIRPLVDEHVGYGGRRPSKAEIDSACAMLAAKILSDLQMGNADLSKFIRTL